MILGMAQAAAAERSIVLSPDSDYPGADYQTVKDIALDQCTKLCIGDPQCKAFTYNPKARWCFLKSEMGPLTAVPGATAGRVVETETVVQPEPPPAPELTLLAQEAKDAARQFADGLRNAPPPETADLASVRAQFDQKFSAKDFTAAIDFAKAAVSLKANDYELWRNLAIAYLSIVTSDSSYQSQLNGNALSAAYVAYERSGTIENRAQALGLLGQALVRTDNYRTGLEIYKKALETQSTPALQQAYEDAKSRYGFRVTGSNVDADSSTPRICVQFSEELRKGRVDFAPFILVDGKAPEAITADGKQVCIEGAKHGERHQITVREGLPSVFSDVTDKPVTLTAFVRDRQPGVRFTGRNFVLPREGRQGIPVISVNTSEIAVDLYHIDTRGLAGLMRGNMFLSQISGYDAQAIADDQGIKLWSGILEAQDKRNEEVTTSLPLSELLKERKPGVYVLTAQPKAAAGTEDWQAKATQWFIVSDIGLTTMSSDEGLDVFVRSLNSAKPIANVSVSLLARNNELLGKAVTDAMGHAKFEGGLMRGKGGSAAAIVTAEADGGDNAFIDLGRAAYDFSDRGVSGRNAPGPIDIFMYTERGVYRPGETVHLTALARDDNATAIANVPLTLIVTRPDGIEYQRYVSQDSGLGGHNVDIALQDTAMTGTWTAAIHSDPKGEALTDTRFLVDYYVPDRIEFDLTSDAKAVSLDEPTTAEVKGRFLYGAPASNLGLEGELIVGATRTLPAYPGYQFGMAEKDVGVTRTTLEELEKTNEEGAATILFQPSELPQTTQPLEAALTIRMVEGGSRAVERQLKLPVALAGSAIGIKPLFEDGSLGEGQQASFEIIGLNRDGSRLGQGALKWELLRVTEDYQWYQTGGSWSYESTEYTDRVDSGTVELKADTPARISAKTEWGKYRLIVESGDPAGPVSSIQFSTGWYFAAGSSDTPDVLQIALDKQSYKPGDIAKVKIVPRFAGTALITVLGETLIDMKAAEVGPQGAEVELKVTDAWSHGTYVTATLYRPEGTGSDHMPGRAIGVAYAGRDAGDRTIAVKLEAPEFIRPRSTLKIPVSLGNLAAGESAYVTVAAVDQGILNLTRYEPPNPEGWYFGQRKLAMELRDVYGQLIDGSLGALGRIRSGGGDEGETMALAMQGTPPEREPVAFYSGIVAVGPDGKAEVSFDIPEFNGSLRLMAVAWTAKSLGHASSDVTVRDEVVVSENLPAFLAPGDTSRLRLDIDNRDGPAGDYILNVSTSDGVTVAGGSKTVALGKGERKAVLMPVTARMAGDQSLTVSLKHQSGLDIERNLSLWIRPGQPPVSDQRLVSLAPGQTLSLTSDMIADRLLGSGNITVAITRSGALDVPGILQALDRYPYGCSEQTTSRALPLLYLEEVAAKSGLEGDAAVKERVQKAIYDVLANQSGNGAFGLWGPASGDLWLDAYVSDFLTRARELNYDVPQVPFDLAITNLQNEIGYTQNVEDRATDIAYALYVLARNKRASIGDIRFYAETKLDAFASPLAKAQLGAALALYGDKARAEQVLTAAFSAVSARTTEDYSRVDYGSNLRDRAALLALAAESNPSLDIIPKLEQSLANSQRLLRYTSTQENAWLLLAARALLSSAEKPKIDVNGQAFEGDFVRKLAAADLQAPMSIVNRAAHPVQAVITTTGVPSVPEPAGGDGFTIERAYFSMDGQPANLAGVAQNERIVVTLKVTQANAWPSKILVTDMLPSGFDIDSPSLVASADLKNFDWLPQQPEGAHLEFRDDRFVAALTRAADDSSEVNFAYVVRAVAPGNFVLPPASVEDMYRPYLNARTATGSMEVIGPVQ
jgi:uncharacterized protein YfaS (alpha-2-macroglobulin family)